MGKYLFRREFEFGASCCVVYCRGRWIDSDLVGFYFPHPITIVSSYTGMCFDCFVWLLRTIDIPHDFLGLPTFVLFVAALSIIAVEFWLGSLCV